MFWGQPCQKTNRGQLGIADLKQGQYSDGSPLVPWIVEGFDGKPPVPLSLHVQLTGVPGSVPPPLPRLLLVISRRISVVRLLFRRSPAKIADLVVPIRIDPIQRSSGGAGSNSGN